MKQVTFIFSLILLLSACETSKTDSSSEGQESLNTNLKSMNKKDQAKKFMAAVNARDTATIKELVHEDYIQHNPFIPTGRAAFLSLLPILDQNGTKVENLRMIEDGDFVVLHNFWNNAAPFGADKVVSFDVLRFDEDGLIAEHWDALMPNTPPNTSKRTLIDGSTEISELDKTAENKAQFIKLFEVILKGEQEAVGQAVMANFQPDYKQHNPSAGDGIEALFGAFGKEQWVYKKQHKVIGEGNFVLSISEGSRRGNPAAFYDLVKFENGKITEHWDIIQDIPSENLANEHTMFNF